MGGKINISEPFTDYFIDRSTMYKRLKVDRKHTTDATFSSDTAKF